MSLPAFDPDFSQFNRITSNQFGSGLQHSYNRYLEGVKTIVASLDIPVGLTPKKLVWQLNKAKLFRYQPTRPPDERYPVPLILVYALINKPFIFDLAPGRSFIEYMVNQGFDVYLLDWGIPGPEDKNITFDDYVTEYLSRAVRKMLRVSNAKEFSMLGYCIGATLSVVYASLYNHATLRNLILLTAPLDFTSDNAGSMAQWLDERVLDIDKLIDTYDNVPGELIKLWAKLLKPMENFVGAYITMWKQLDNEAAVRGWQAVNRWVEDAIPFAGEAFRQFVKEYFRENQLINRQHFIKGQCVDPVTIRANLLNVIAKYDHLVAQEQSTSIMDLVSSTDKELKIIPSTHVGLMASHRAKEKLWPDLVDWLSARSL